MGQVVFWLGINLILYHTAASLDCEIVWNALICLLISLWDVLCPLPKDTRRATDDCWWWDRAGCTCDFQCRLSYLRLTPCNSKPRLVILNNLLNQWLSSCVKRRSVNFLNTWRSGSNNSHSLQRRHSSSVGTGSHHHFPVIHSLTAAAASPPLPVALQPLSSSNSRSSSSESLFQLHSTSRPRLHLV